MNLEVEQYVLAETDDYNKIHYVEKETFIENSEEHIDAQKKYQLMYIQSRTNGYRIVVREKENKQK